MIALGHGVARGGLGAEEEGPGREVMQFGSSWSRWYEVDDVQGVEQLALILVEALDLHVEDGVRVEQHTLRSPWP